MSKRARAWNKGLTLDSTKPNFDERVANLAIKMTKHKDHSLILEN